MAQFILRLLFTIWIEAPAVKILLENKKRPVSKALNSGYFFGRVVLATDRTLKIWRFELDVSSPTADIGTLFLQSLPWI